MICRAIFANWQSLWRLRSLLEWCAASATLLSKWTIIFICFPCHEDLYGSMNNMDTLDTIDTWVTTDRSDTIDTSNTTGSCYLETLGTLDTLDYLNKPYVGHTLPDLWIRFWVIYGERCVSCCYVVGNLWHVVHEKSSPYIAEAPAFRLGRTRMVYVLYVAYHQCCHAKFCGGRHKMIDKSNL